MKTIKTYTELTPYVNSLTREKLINFINGEVEYQFWNSIPGNTNEKKADYLIKNTPKMDENELVTVTNIGTKGKARELIKRFANHSRIGSIEINLNSAKNCAEIAVDQVFDEFILLNGFEDL